MSENKQYLLIDHLDNNLSGQEMLAVEELIRSDRDMAKEWETLHIAVDAILEAGLCDQVAAIGKEYKASKAIATIKPQGAIVRGLFSNKLRIAASILLFVMGASLYK